LDITAYHAKYFAYELTKRSASDKVQKLVASLMDAQVDLNPHQVEAALFAFRSPLSSGAILADEVGLGKTIEAAIVIAQKWAEKRRKILIVVPANIRKQWMQELSEKFFLESMILEMKSFKEEIKKGNFNPFDQNRIVVTSYQFIHKNEAYVRAIKWDLVVIDEAHRLRNVYKKTNKIANSVKNSLYSFPKILLTATPLQNSLLELYGLVSIIDEYTFGDLDSFKNRYLKRTDETIYNDLKERLAGVCIRTLRKQVYEYVKYTKRIPITQEFLPNPDEQKLYNLVSAYLQDDNLYALPKSQRKLMTLILRRLLASSTYAISGTLEALAKKLELIVSGAERNEPADIETVFPDYEQYDELSDEWEDDGVEEPTIKYYTKADIEAIKIEAQKLREFFELANSIKRNSKGEVLLTALQKGFTEAQKVGAPRKAIIFTESTRTQKYVLELLESTEFRGKIVLFNGSNTDEKSRQIYKQYVEKYTDTDKISGSKTADTRAAIIEHFRDTAEIMIATEAAAEGVNLQFCALVVNYDLPWNPQRIEQRIGRCHRYGQKFDVVVVNFLNRANAADQRVYRLLFEKFKLFEGVFGASDEVLGAIESGVDFEKRIIDIYQKCRNEIEIQQSFDDLQKELEDVISINLEDARKKLLENFDQEVIEKLRVRNIESKDYLNIYQDWLLRITRFFLKDYAVFNEDASNFYLKKNPFPSEKIHPGPYSFGKSTEAVNIYRIGHPLAVRIIESCKNYDTETAMIVFDYSNSGSRISVLEKYINFTGWLTVCQITFCGFECQDEILISACTDDLTEVNKDEAKRIFNLPAAIYPSSLPDENVRNHLEVIENRMIESLKAGIEKHNKDFSQQQTDKIIKWADDLIQNAENEIDITKKRIKEVKRNLRQAVSGEELLALNKELTELEAKKRKQRQQIFDIEDEIESKRDELISEIEERMQQNITRTELFTIGWRIV